MTDKRQEVPTDGDARIMLRFQAGDVGSFDTLFARHIRSIVQLAYRFVRNQELAEELAQEVFLRVHDAARTYRPDAKFTTWLYRIAANVCLNEIRRPEHRARFEPLESVAPDDIQRKSWPLADPKAQSPMEDLQRRAIAAALKKALRELPDNQRMAFILCKYQELSYAETAEIMDLSEKAVKSLIHRAKESLASRLKPVLPGLL